MHPVRAPISVWYLRERERQRERERERERERDTDRERERERERERGRRKEGAVAGVWRLGAASWVRWAEDGGAVWRWHMSIDRD
jgi:hypothetical protein